MSAPTCEQQCNCNHGSLKNSFDEEREEEKNKNFIVGRKKRFYYMTSYSIAVANIL
jgi:hypothetical protein